MSYVFDFGKIDTITLFDFIKILLLEENLVAGFQTDFKVSKCVQNKPQ